MARGWGRTWLDGGVNRDHGRVSCATVLCWDALERISSFYDYNCLTASYSPAPPNTRCNRVIVSTVFLWEVVAIVFPVPAPATGQLSLLQTPS